MKARGAMAKAVECLEDARWALSGNRAANAVGRAYYAIYHAAEALLIAHLGHEFSSHRAVQGAFGKHFAKAGIVPPRLHQVFLKAFEARHDADYDIMSVTTMEEARNRVAEAEEFVAFIRSLVETWSDAQ